MVYNNNSAADQETEPADSWNLTAPNVLSEILRAGAQKLLRAAIEKEVADYINSASDGSAGHHHRSGSP